MFQKLLKTAFIILASVSLLPNCFRFSNSSFHPKSKWSEISTQKPLSCKDLNYGSKSIYIKDVTLSESTKINMQNQPVNLSIFLRDLKLKKIFLLQKPISDLDDIHVESGAEELISESDSENVEFFLKRNISSLNESIPDLLKIERNTEDKIPRFEKITQTIWLSSRVEKVLFFDYIETTKEHVLLTREFIEADDFDHEKRSLNEKGNARDELNSPVYKIVARKLLPDLSTFEPLFEIEADFMSFFDVVVNKRLNSQERVYFFLVDYGLNFENANRLKLVKFFANSKKLVQDPIMIGSSSKLRDWAMVSITTKVKQIWFKYGEDFSAKADIVVEHLKLGEDLNLIQNPAGSLELRHNSGAFLVPRLGGSANIEGSFQPILVQNWLDAESQVQILIGSGGEVRIAEKTGIIEENWSLNQAVLSHASSSQKLWLLFNKLESRSRKSTKICVQELNL